MTHLKTAAWCFVAMFASALRMFAVAPEVSTNPFQHIAAANIFRLRTPAAESIAPQVKPPLPPIALTGIVDGYGELFALLEVSAANAPKMSLKLGPGESEGGVEVLRVDIKAGTVEVRISDTITNLVLNRIAPPMPAKPSAQPVTAISQNAVPSLAQPKLGRDETALVIEAERERLRQAGDPTATLMPITHLTPAGAPGTEAFSGDLQPASANSVGPLQRRSSQRSQSP
jgi:hypothetical protein